MSAIRFLTAVARSVHAGLFQSADALKQVRGARVCPSVCVCVCASVRTGRC